MGAAIWDRCLDLLQDEYPAQQYDTWIKPLQAERRDSDLRLLAPNQHVLTWVTEEALDRIRELLAQMEPENTPLVSLGIGQFGTSDLDADRKGPVQISDRRTNRFSESNANSLNPGFTFGSFVEGKCNELARAAAVQVANNAGSSYNPLLLYGGAGLGKTHLMQAVGHELAARDGARVVYISSQRFVRDMVNALQQGIMEEFMQHYRSVDALLVDDIQFFARKLHSQEEFFHVFNSLLESGSQMVLTCDRYPKDIDGLEERLKSRFVWGLTVAVEPPELETRVAILHKKAEKSGYELPSDVAFFIAERIRSNVRELEGTLRRIIASAHFSGRAIDLDLVRESLKDLIAMRERQISLDNIQRTVAEYYKIKVADLHSKRRNRSVTRPRQVAMALAKELTRHSLPEIGDAFGGRDHTTVLHACRKVAELKESSADIREDYKNLVAQLTD